jgi:hypothetical protein
MSLTVIPMARYDEPDYPTGAILDDHPELLKLVPRRWRANPAAMTALAGACLLTASITQSSAKSKAGSAAAPVSKHGPGRWSEVDYSRPGAPLMGVPLRNPPILTMIPEAAAREIIRSEARKFGIDLAPDAKTLNGLPLSVVNEKDGRTRTSTKKLNLKLDGTDKRRNISYEYVSETDFSSWRLKTVADRYEIVYDYEGTAKLLRESLVKAKPKGFYAVFYDPCLYVERKEPEPRSLKHSTSAATEVREGTAIAEPEKLLRLQVRDFIKWLKAQGVI